MKTIDEAGLQANNNIIQPKWFMFVFGFITTMFSLAVDALGLYARFKDTSTQELLAEIQHIQEELASIKGDLRRVTNNIQEASIRSQYVSAQRVVFESLRILEYYQDMKEGATNATQEDVDYWQSELAKWGGLLRESITFLMDGFLGKGFIGSDLLEIITKISTV